MSKKYNPDSVAPEWEDFMNELENSEQGREDRTSTRIDTELNHSLADLDFGSYRRPDILSAIVRAFIKRNMDRLQDRVVVKKSIFTPNRPQES